jgi:peptidyl-prolyl cis-trans isomerase C
MRKRVARYSAWMLVVGVIGAICIGRAGAAEVLASSDGVEVTGEEFERYIGTKPMTVPVSELSEATREGLLREYIVLRQLAADSGVDEEEADKIRESVLRAVMISEVRRRPLGEGLDLSDAGIRAYYDGHQDEFRVEEAYVFRHIFLSTADIKMLSTSPMVAEADRLNATEVARGIDRKRKRAETAYQLLREGQVFLEVAREYSDSGGQDRPSERGMQIAAQVREDGLYVGERRIMPEMENAIRALRPGEYSPVFETQHGFVIVKLEKYIPGGIKSFEEVRERLARRMAMEARRDLREEFDNEILGEFEVEERFWVLGMSSVATEEVVFSISGNGKERRFTVGEYRSLLETLPPITRERLESSAEERETYLREYVLPDEAAYLLARKKGLENDEDVKRRVEVQLLQEVALKGFNRRVEERVDSMPVEEEDLRAVWADPVSQRRFSVGGEVCVEGFAVGTMAGPDASPSEQHFGKQLALLRAKEIAKRLQEGDSYGKVAAAFTLDATEEEAGAQLVNLEGGVSGILLTDKPLGSHRVRALWDLGWVTGEDLREMGVRSSDAAAAVMAMASGEVTGEPLGYSVGDSEGLPGPEGYFVFRVTGRREPYVRPLSQVREQVEKMLRARREAQLKRSMFGQMLEGVEYELNRSAWGTVWRRLREQ